MLGFFRSSRVSSVKYLLLVGCIALVSACGGGGKDSPSAHLIPGSSSALSSIPASSVMSVSSTAAAEFVANAGPDLTVNAGTTITLNPNAAVAAGEFTSFHIGDGNLEITTTSAKPTDIVSITWVRIEGPVVAFQTLSSNDGIVSFIAPATGAEKSIKISYKLTITRANGSVAVDTVTFTILRVNQAATVNAGIDQTVEGLKPVTVAATAVDSDGSIASYQWLQTAGSPVALTGATSSSLSFIAPSTEVQTTLEFELTVTDSDGLSSKDKVSIMVTPDNAPQVKLYFPAATGVYKGGQISAAGVATAKGATISSVTVDVGGGAVAATLSADGSWRVDGLPVPVAAADFSLQVIATDSAGRTGKTLANLKTNGESAGTKVAGSSWRNTLGVAVDSGKNLAYVLATGNFLNEVRLFAIDLATGHQGADISNFANTSQGIDSSAIVAMAYDAEQHLVYFSTLPADAAIAPQIISIDTLTGQRSLVSDKTRGTGADLIKPAGLSVGANHILYVADNATSTIVAVDTVTGNRSVVASSLTVDFEIDRPFYLVADTTQANHRLFVLPNAVTNYILQLNLTLSPAVSSLVSDSFDTAQGTTALHSEPQGIVLAAKLNSLFVDDQGLFSQIVKIDIATGNRTKLLATDWLNSRIAYDDNRQLLYLVDGMNPGLFVVDPVTAQKVLISR